MTHSDHRDGPLNNLADSRSQDGSSAYRHLDASSRLTRPNQHSPYESRELLLLGVKVQLRLSPHWGLKWRAVTRHWGSSLVLLYFHCLFNGER